MNRLGLGVDITRGVSLTSLPSLLFSTAGSRGFFYDFNDYTTQFTDTAGTTAITGVGQSLGLVLDKSAGLALGPELVTNGDFSGGLTGWAVSGTASVVSGQAQMAGNTTASGRITATITSLVVGRTYRVSCEQASITGAGVGRVYISTTASIGTAISTVNLVNGINSHVFVATATTHFLLIDTSSVSPSIVLTVDNISVRELPGNHATQATAGSRALTQVRPMFTQRNRAVGSELPENNFYWASSGTSNGVTYTRVATGVDTDGLAYADYSVVGTATADSYFEPQVAVTQRIPAATGQTWTASMIARRLSGAAPGAGEGVTPYIRGETAPTTSTEFSALLYNAASAETTLVTTFTLANAATNQIRSAVSFRVASGSTANYTMRVKGYQLELGSARTTYQPAVSGELRNRAIGSGAVGNATDWLSPSTSNGITATRVAFGFDADGLPYNDWQVTGTASAASSVQIRPVVSSRTPATTGQAWTASARVQVISGTAPPATNGVRVSLDGETAPSTFTEFGGGSVLAPTTETLAVTSYTLANASTNQARPTIAFVTQSGTTVNYTVRIKGLQFEQASTYSRYQRTITANEWYEPGFTSYRGIRFDGSDDFLQTAAIDFAGAESLGPELVTNGTFASNITGWSDTSSAGGSIAWNAAGYLDLINATGTARTQQDLAVTAGRTYKFVVSNPGANTVDVYAGSTSGGIDLLSTTLTTGQTGTYILTATSSLLSLGFRNFGAGTTDSIDNVSVKEVLFPADKMTVVAGVRKLSDAARGMLVELGPPAATGTFRLEAPSAASPNYFFLSTGTASAGAGPVVTYAAPISNVLSGLSDISGDLATLRVNGTQVAQSTADQGTGNYSNDIVFIGRRGGTTLPFNGVLTFLCVINRTLTAGELAALEAYANSRTGAY